MPDDSKLLFEVVCKGCRRTLVTVDRIRDPEIGLVGDHIRACSASEPLGDTPMFGRGDGPRSSRGSGAGVGGTRRMADKSKYDFPLRSAAKALGVSPYLRLVRAQAAEPRSVGHV